MVDSRRGLWDYGNQAIERMIPIALQARRLEAEKAMQEQAFTERRAMMDEQFNQQSMKLMLDAQKTKDEIKLRTISDIMKQAQEAGDAETYNSAKAQLGELIGASFPGGATFKQKPPGSLDALLAQRLTENNASIDEVISTSERLGRAKSQKNEISINNIPPGNMPPAKNVVGELQKDVISSESQLGELRNIKDLYQKEFLQLSGKMKGSAYRMADYINLPIEKMRMFGFSPEEKKKFLGRRTEFHQSVEQLFNLYRKDITGAAAAVQELERLKLAMLNTDQTPEEFESSFNNFERSLKRTVRLRNKFLRDGFNVKDEAVGGKAFDSAFVSGGDDSVEARGAELREKYSKSGLSGEELKNKVNKTLDEEGYLE